MFLNPLPRGRGHGLGSRTEVHDGTGAEPAKVRMLEEEVIDGGRETHAVDLFRLDLFEDRLRVEFPKQDQRHPHEIDAENRQKGGCIEYGINS